MEAFQKVGAKLGLDGSKEPTTFAKAIPQRHKSASHLLNLHFRPIM